MKTLIEEIVKYKKFSFIFFITIFFLTIRLLFLPLDQNILQLFPLYTTTAMVFLWYAYDNYTDIKSYNNIANIFLKKMNLENRSRKINFEGIAKVQAGIEVICALSFLTGLLIIPFSAIASLILLTMLFAYEASFGSILIRDFGMLGATLTIFLTNTVH